jgi:hypothetical protein
MGLCEVNEMPHWHGRVVNHENNPQDHRVVTIFQSGFAFPTSSTSAADMAVDETDSD